MATKEQLAYRHKKYIQRKRSRDDGSNAYSTDSDSSLEPDQENFTSNLPKQRRLQTTKLTPKQKFKTEKAINELRLRIQLIDLNDNEPETIDLTKDDTEDDTEVNIVQKATTFSDASRTPSATSATDSNGNILKNCLAKRGRPQVSTNKIEASLSDDEINEKLIKLEMPPPMGPPPNRRVTFGGFSHSSKTHASPKKTKLVTFGTCDRPAELTKTTEHRDMERIKFSVKKMGRSKTIKDFNIEDEWKMYKTANLSLSEFASRCPHSSFGTK